MPGLMSVGRVGQRPRMDLSLVMSSVALATWIDGRSVDPMVLWFSAFSQDSVNALYILFRVCGSRCIIS